jgi:hypothetical protein
MKTPMQELIEWLNDYPTNVPTIHKSAVISKAESLLEKEKEQRMEAWCKGYDSCDEDISGDSPLEYYNKAFNTNEK